MTPKQVKSWFAKEYQNTPEDQLSRHPSIKATFRIFASSHGEHGLPEELENLRPTYDWCLPFDENMFDTAGGRKIRDVKVQLIRQSKHGDSNHKFFGLFPYRIKHLAYKRSPEFKKELLETF